MTLRQAAQQALEAMEIDCVQRTYAGGVRIANAAIALRAALAEPEQEPVGWQWLDTANYRKNLPADAIREHWRPLYTAPTPRKPLPTIEIIGMYNAQYHPDADDGLGFARAIERAHGITGETK